MTPEALKSTIAQTYLCSLGYYRQTIDGEWGPASRAAAVAWYDTARLKIYPRLAQTSLGMVRQMGSRDAELLRTLAAQILLADLRLYTGEIDGEWGPQSLAAAARWQYPVPDEKPGRSLDPYGVAKRYLGTKEIPGKNHCGVIMAWYRRLQISIFDDETPWCSTFVNECAMEAGYERTGKLNARSWLDVGEKITLADARIGCDVLIFERGSTGWEGHVTFYAGMGSVRGTVRCLGGNQSDEVDISTYSTTKLLGVRRLRSLDQLQGKTNKI